MAASTNRDNLGVQQLNVPNFRGGINTALPANEIQDNEIVDALNFEYDWDGNLVVRNGVDPFNAEDYATRITSLHYFTTESGAAYVLYTNANDLYRADPDGTNVTDITSTLTLPNNTFWQWRTFQGIAIGVNQATSGDNPVKVDNTGAAAALGGTPPKAKFIEVWNNRIWVVSASEPNQVRACQLGDPEDWTDTGADGAVSIDIDNDDGDEITGLIAFKERLFVLKRERIFVIQPISSSAPNTDPENLEVKLFSGNVGCVSAYTVQTVLDDVLFLAEGGVASLTSAQIVADFKSALISKNVAEIARIKKISDEFASMVLDDASQYWLSIPAALSPTSANIVYVLDYTDLAQGQVRWSRFDGLVAGTAYTSFIDSDTKVYLVAGMKATGDFRIFNYVSQDVDSAYDDDGVAYTKQLITKAYDGNNPLFHKHWFKWGLGFELISTPISINLEYKFDNNFAKTGSYGFTLTGVQSGSLWGGFNWGSGSWGAQNVMDFAVWRSFLTKSFGQKSQFVQIKLTNTLISQAFSIKHLTLLYAIENQVGVTAV